MIRSFDGDASKLGNAEKFFALLIALPSYKMRIEGLLLKSEFQSRFDVIQPEIEVIIAVCKDLLSDHTLKEFLRVVLQVGNFMNNVSVHSLIILI